MNSLPRLLLGATLAAAAPASSAPRAETRPLLVQGALRLETARLIDQLKDVKVESVGPWTFWRGTVDGYPVIVSRTRMGTAHAAAATALAIEKYHPVAVINQGTAGGHQADLHVGDIVLGSSAVSLGAFKTPHRIAGTGSSTLDWAPLDLIERPGDEDGELHEGQVMRLHGDRTLLAAALRAKPSYTKGRVVEGVIGSSDVWNEEIDRIERLRSTFGTSVEEMETAPAGQISKLFGVPFLGIRVVTANVTNGGAYDPKTGEACQDFVLQVIRAYVAGLK